MEIKRIAVSHTICVSARRGIVVFRGISTAVKSIQAAHAFVRRREPEEKEQSTTKKPYCPADEINSDDGEINRTERDAKDANDARNTVPV